MARQDRIGIQTLLFQDAGPILGRPVLALGQHPFQQVHARVLDIISRFPWRHATRHVLEVNATSSLT